MTIKGIGVAFLILNIKFYTCNEKEIITNILGLFEQIFFQINECSNLIFLKLHKGGASQFVCMFFYINTLQYLESIEDSMLLANSFIRNHYTLKITLET